MKKYIAILAAILLLLSASALAESTPDPAELPGFATFRQAVDVANEYCIGQAFCAALIRRGSHYYRAVALYDEHAMELNAVLQEAWMLSDDGELLEPTEEQMTLDEYVMTLPVQYTEELTVTPLSREELDALAGKTLEELLSEPWGFRLMNYPRVPGAAQDVVFPALRGFCEYRIVIDEPAEVYQERRARDHFDPVTVMSLRHYLDLTVRSVTCTGVYSNLLDLSRAADGTRNRDVSPEEDYDVDFVLGIADRLVAAWGNETPDQAAKDAMTLKLAEEYPDQADLVWRIVESYR